MKAGNKMPILSKNAQPFKRDEYLGAYAIRNPEEYEP